MARRKVVRRRGARKSAVGAVAVARGEVPVYRRGGKGRARTAALVERVREQAPSYADIGRREEVSDDIAEVDAYVEGDDAGSAENIAVEALNIAQDVLGMVGELQGRVERLEAVRVAAAPAQVARPVAFLLAAAPGDNLGLSNDFWRGFSKSMGRAEEVAGDPNFAPTPGAAAFLRRLRELRLYAQSRYQEA